MYSGVTSYPQRTSRGLHQVFLVQIKQGPVKQNKRAHRSSHHCGKKESSSFSVEIRVREVRVVCSHQVFCFFPFSQTKTANSVVSRGMTKCVRSWTCLHERASELPEYERSHCHRFTPSHSVKHIHALSHTHAQAHT